MECLLAGQCEKLIGIEDQDLRARCERTEIPAHGPTILCRALCHVLPTLRQLGGDGSEMAVEVVMLRHEVMVRVARLHGARCLLPIGPSSQ